MRAIPPPVETGVSLPVVYEAAELFADPGNTPKTIGALKGNSPLRQQFIELAAYLDDYNNRRLTE
jgi:hypothetical protein